MDFDGFILEYAADGVEYEGEILKYIVILKFPLFYFAFRKRQDKLKEWLVFQKPFFLYFSTLFLLYTSIPFL